MDAAKQELEPKRKLEVATDGGRTREQLLADITLDPAASATKIMLAFNRGSFGNTGDAETFRALRESIQKVRKGNLAGPEAMLVTQAESLNAIFTELARRSALNMGEYAQASERYMRLALKAQAQCRATIETLAAIKNPPVIIARQANIANGPQQVNNGPAPHRADDSANSPNELLEHRVEQRVDFGSARTPGSSNPTLVAVESSNGT